MARATKPKSLHITAFLLALTGLLAPSRASAFCRQTTCEKLHCATDAHSCVSEGTPLSWASSCITISVQADGAQAVGIDYEAAKASVERAVGAWTSVDCPGGGHPSLNVKVDGPVECKQSEYSMDHHNANIVMFRDDVWPYAGRSADTLGFTELHFDPDTGELYDADIEINATEEPLAVGREPKPTEADLDSIMTHEVGHLLGLAHSPNAEATMIAGYLDGTFELRTPAPDDIAGICAIYPPSRQATSSSCEPRHGFSSSCAADQVADPGGSDPGAAGAAGADDGDGTSRGCAFSPVRAGSNLPLLAASAALLLAARKRRSQCRREG